MEEITMKNNLREQFEAIDEDGSGEIDQDELSNALEALGYKIAREELMNFFVDEDAEEEGTLKDGIDIDGFVKIIKGIAESANKDVQDMHTGDTLGSEALLEGKPMQGGTLAIAVPTKMLVLELSEYARVLSQVRLPHPRWSWARWGGGHRFVGGCQYTVCCSTSSWTRWGGGHRFIVGCQYTVCCSTSSCRSSAHQSRGG
jgi:hypothetical protein